MKHSKIAICDNNAEDALLLKKYLENILLETEVFVYYDPDCLLHVINRAGNPYDVVFLELQMEQMDGISVAREIRRKDLLVPIIFTTEDDTCYREAFEVFAFQYLLKPLSRKRVETALAPLRQRWNENDERAIHFRYRSQVHTIRHRQIVYLSSSLHTVNFHLTNGNIIQYRGKLDDFKEQLEDSNFLRCHQSFFVNMEYIEGMKADSFILKDAIIPISRSCSKRVQEEYGAFLEKSGGGIK
jgi:DNA-binding LytR/AlgR family response regulator